MTNRIADISLRQAALVAGFGYLIIFIFGGFASFSGIAVPADAAATADNIMASESLFCMGIACWLFALTADAIVAWALCTSSEQCELLGSKTKRHISSFQGLTDASTETSFA